MLTGTRNNGAIDFILPDSFFSRTFTDTTNLHVSFLLFPYILLTSTRFLRLPVYTHTHTLIFQ